MLLWICFALVAVVVVLKIILSKKSDSVACLVGKTAIVTGGNSGIGYETSVLLASRGCRIIIADKDDSTSSCQKIQQLTGNKNVVCKYLNLASLTSVRRFAEDIQKHEAKIDILINNAGVASVKEEQSEDGLSMTMQINYFGAFLLTHLLINSLRKSGSSRVIFLTSSTSILHNLSLENLNSLSPTNTGMKKILIYANSKICGVIACLELGKRVKKFGITCNLADPWVARTTLFSLAHKPDLFARQLWLLPMLLGNSPATSAQTPFHVASSEALEGVTGQIFIACRPSFLKDRILRNEELCKRIWEKSEELVKLKPEEKLTVE